METELKVGDRVKVINKWVGYMGQNPDGLMDKYLGKEFTIEALGSIHPKYGQRFKAVEKGFNEWTWSEPMIQICDKIEQLSYDENKGWNF